MCSLHARVVKKCNGEFETLRGEMNAEISDDTYYRLKVTKQKASDDLMVLKGCAAAERYLKFLRAPTPAKKSVVMVQQHVENLIKFLR